MSQICLPKKIKFYTLLVSGLFLINCNVRMNELQDIEIHHYSQKEKNVEIVKEIIYYDPSYLAAKLPSLSKAASQGVQVGYFIRQSDGQACFRVTYNLKNPAVATNLQALKSDFADYVPKLASFHASKQPIFLKLQPVGKSWIQTLFSDSWITLYSKGSKLLKQNVDQTKFQSFVTQLHSKYGKVVSIEPANTQYYEPFSTLPESVSLFYETKFEQGKTSTVRISLYKENGSWVVMGFAF